MSYIDYTEDLLGLKDVIVTKIKEIDNEKHIYLDCKLQTQVCPHCHFPTKRVHSYRVQTVKDIPSFGKLTLLHIRKRRYYCPFCGHVFQEKLSFLNRYQRTTPRLLAQVLNDFRSSDSTKAIAKRNGISPGVATRMFRFVSYGNPKLPKVLSIDEFKGNAGRKYQCILADPIHRKVLDILPNRLTTELKNHFLSTYTLDQRKNVEYFVMDMSGQFAEIVQFCFPNAKIIIDKFHVCRHVLWALEKKRKDIQSSLSPDKRKWFKRSRFILLKNSDKLTQEEISKLEIMMKYSEELRTAYALKESFCKLLSSSSRAEAEKNYLGFQLCVHITNIPEFEKCYEMIAKRKERFLRAYSTGYTNGFTEGCNNRIKVLKRNCYGVRNFERFRNRILHMMSA